MSSMATTYPAKIDNSISLPTVIDNSSPVQGLTVNRLRDAILAIEDELGVQPSSVYGTVRHRLDILEAGLNNLQIIKLNEDLGGTLNNPLVIGLQGRPLSDVAPSFNQVLSWNGIAWVPRTVSGGGGGSQDLATTLGLGNNADGYLITNLSDPVSAQDAATKNYVDTHTFVPPNLKAVLSTGNITDGYDIIVSAGDVITITDAPLLFTDAVNKGYVDGYIGTQSLLFIRRDGTAPFTGDQSLGNHKLTSVTDPTLAQDAATKNYVDGYAGLLIKKDGSVPFTGDQSMGSHKLTNVTNPTSAQDAATKSYVDTWDGYGFRSGTFEIPAVLSTPGWNVTGSFLLPSTENVKLHAVGCVSDPSLTMNLRVFRFAGGTLDVVPSLVVQISSLTDVNVFSGSVSLSAAAYQYQTEVVGHDGYDGYFGSLKFVTLMKG